MRKIYSIILCLMLVSTAYAATIQGVVVDSKNQPLVGVSVLIAESANPVITDLDGAFVLEVEEGSELMFSLLGYKTGKQAAKDGMVVVLKKKGVEEPDGWRMFILANGLYAPMQKDYGFGFTLGMMKTFGWYISYAMAPSFTFAKYGEHKYDSKYYLYNGNMKTTRFSAVAGFVAGRVVYFYAGVGYGKRDLYCQAYNDEGEPKYWIPSESKSAIDDGMMWDCGVMADIKGFGLSVGASCLTDYTTGAYWELKFGLGGCFNLKGKKK